MTPPPNPVNPNKLLRAQGLVVGLAVAAIVLFILVYVVMESMGVAPFVRLMSALCVPPGVIAIGLGVFILTRRPVE